MGKWIEGKLKKEQADEKRRHRNDKYADFCFALANTIIGSLVIACTFFLLQDESKGKENIVYILMIVGLLVFVGLCSAGSKFLK